MRCIKITSTSSYEIESPPIQSKTTLLSPLKIQSEVLHSIHDFFHQNGFIQLMPVILSPITDPLCHPVYEAHINYLGQQFQLTKSMIFHKQIAIAKLNVEGIYIMSPNIRLEVSALRDSGKHLTEFTQLDIEIKEKKAQDFMSLTEDLIIYIFSRVRKYCKEELEKLESNIRIPQKPFKIYWSWDLREEFGDDFGSRVSFQEKDPFWITDFKREFYDREDPERKGHYINYDLYYPEGFGEALSGGERDFEYETLLRKIKERNQDWNPYQAYLSLSKQGLLVPSTGGGLGIERLVRFLTKKQHIREVSLFPKVPGEKIDF